jgi:hypothetical protein
MDNERVKEGREESKYNACRNSRFCVLDRRLQPRFILAKVRSDDGMCSTCNLVSRRVKLILLVPQTPPKEWA